VSQWLLWRRSHAVVKFALGLGFLQIPRPMQMWLVGLLLPLTLLVQVLWQSLSL